MNRAHQLALRREWQFADASESLCQAIPLEAGFSRRDDERTLGGITLHGPMPVMLMKRGVVGAVRDGQRSFQFDLDRAAYPLSAILPDVTNRSVSGAGEEDAPAGGYDL